jgi:hypothetical protein
MHTCDSGQSVRPQTVRCEACHVSSKTETHQMDVGGSVQS